MAPDLSYTVVLIQHSDNVPPGALSAFLSDHSIRHLIVRPDKGESMPLTHAHVVGSACCACMTHDCRCFNLNVRAVVSLGGPMGSYDEYYFPWLAAEKAYLAALALRAKRPVLGICLGAQLLADACGGKVYQSPRFECGYIPLLPTEAAHTDPVMATIFKDEFRYRPVSSSASSSTSASSSSSSSSSTSTASSSTTTTVDVNNNLIPPSSSPLSHTPSPSSFDVSVLMHHGDTYYLPPTAIPLATSDAPAPYCYFAAFRLRDAPHTLAVQFHPEATIDELSLWVRLIGGDRYAAVGTTGDRLIASVEERKPQATKTTRAFFEAWWTHDVLQPEQQEKASSVSQSS